VRAAAADYLDNPGEPNYIRLARAVEPPRQEFFRRLNLAPGATAAIVDLRKHLLEELAGDRTLAGVDYDLQHLLSSWFNRGFLVLRRIDWSTPANILEKIIAYEAVHRIEGWDDLRRRLDPSDRRCFAFFHPSLVDEPLIFVEVALMQVIPASIQALLAQEQLAPESQSGAQPTVAVFYSISNCQEGLRGISFGNFLIKQVVEELAREIPSLKTFVTLSPAPGFAQWLDRQLALPSSTLLAPAERVQLQLLADPAWIDDGEEEGGLEKLIMELAAYYFLEARNAFNRPVDPVTRFHLGNGARLERINWKGDVSAKGLAEAHGLMVNYLYDLKDIEKNHEAFANDGVVAASRAVRLLARRKSAEKMSPALQAATIAGTPKPQVSLRAPPGAADTSVKE
jgi:malonyl-CoA decarboxylase